MHAGLLATIASLGLVLAGPTLAAQTSNTTTRFVEIHGAKVYVEIEGHGPPIVFLHGGILYFDNSFAAQRAAFGADHTVIGIDRVGHGHSPDDGKPFSYQQMADDTAAVIGKLGIGPVDVVGWSDGGNIGLLLAHDHPELVRKLVITGANLRPGLPPDELERRAHWSDAQVADKTRQIEAQLPPHFKIDYEAVNPAGPAHWQAFLIKSYRLWTAPVVIEPAALKSIAAPVLVIAGDHDFTSIEETTEIYRGLPHGQLMIVPATGHGTLEDRPALMNLAIREFLDQAP